MGIINKFRNGWDEFSGRISTGGLYNGSDEGKLQGAMRYRRDFLMREIEKYGEQLNQLKRHFPGEAGRWEKLLDLTLRELARQYLISPFV